MIYLFTGSPGAGKTLNLIKFIVDNKEWKGRPVYAYNIRGLNVPGWESISEDQAKDWQSLPDGSIVILDEAQDLFRPRKVGDKVPEYLAGLEKHRHRGFDFFLTTQSPMLLDTHLRRLVYQHRHIERPFGLKKCRCLLWQKCVNDPDDHFARQDCTKSTVSIDKRIFALYESAEVHTVKPKIPLRLFFYAAVLIAVIVAILSVFSSFKSRTVQHLEPGSNVLPVAAVVSQVKRVRPTYSYVEGCLVNADRGVCECYNAAVSFYCKRGFRLGELDYSGMVGTGVGDQAQPATPGPT